MSNTKQSISMYDLENKVKQWESGVANNWNYNIQETNWQMW